MQHRLSVMVDKTLFEQLHKFMGYELESEEGEVLFRLYDGDSKQGWYRIVLRAGLASKRQEFEMQKRKKEQMKDYVEDAL